MNSKFLNCLIILGYVGIRRGKPNTRGPTAWVSAPYSLTMGKCAERQAATLTLILAMLKINRFYFFVFLVKITIIWTNTRLCYLLQIYNKKWRGRAYLFSTLYKY